MAQASHSGTRRGPAHRRQHRQAAGAAAQAGEIPENYQRPSLARRGAFGGEGLSAKLKAVRRGNPMDQRIESFLADVLALAGEDPDASAKGCGSLSPTARKSSGRRKRTSP